MTSIIIANSEPIKVVAFDFETRTKIREFDSINKAARGLFIRSANGIHSYLFGYASKKPMRKRRGVADYKTGRKYHFEVAQPATHEPE